MSQHDFDIANQLSANLRVDLNNALKALASLSSGATAPTDTFANMLWYDTANNTLKMRAEANNAWIDLGVLNQSSLSFAPANAVPIGAVNTFAMNSAPSGWLSCDGSAVSRTTYSGLFSAVGTTYGTGDGSTTFTLPDLRGEFVRGLDNGRGVDSGRALGSAQADEFEAHNHDMYVDVTTTGDNLTITNSSGNDEGGLASTIGKPWMVETGGSETRPRNIALLYCIKY